jgi:hypothetical protein
VRVKYLLKPDDAGLKVAALPSQFDLRSSALTPALSRRERVVGLHRPLPLDAYGVPPPKPPIARFKLTRHHPAAMLAYAYL